VNPADGSEKWLFTTPGPPQSSPAIGADGTIYIGDSEDNLITGSPASHLFAVTDGGGQGLVSEDWAFTANSHVFTPTIGADGTIYFACYLGDTNLYAINPTGTEKWASSFISPPGFPVIGPSGTIYVMGQTNLGVPTGPVVEGIIAIDPGTGAQSLFLSPGGYPYVIDGAGTIYFVAGDNVSAASPGGTILWTFVTGGIPQGFGLDTIGDILFGDQDQTFRAVKTDGTLRFSASSFCEVAGICQPAIDSASDIYLGANISNFDGLTPSGSVQWSSSFGGSEPAIGANGTVYAVVQGGPLEAYGLGAPP